MKRFSTPAFTFVSLLFFFCFTTLKAQQKLNIDTDWRFHFGHAANAEKDFNYSIANIFSKSGLTTGTALANNFDDKNWTAVNLPHDWAVELPFVYSANFDVQSHGYKPVGGLYPETSIGWYRKHFTVARKDSGSRFQLTFDGIFRNANIWVNGFFVGNNFSGYLGATYDITDYLNYNADNIITVRVDASQYEGWFYEGAGIYRHVWLTKKENCHFETDGVFAYATVKGNQATIQVEASIENSGLESSSCNAYFYLTDRNGKLLKKSTPTPISIGINGKVAIKQSIVLQQSRLWTLEDPYLYRVVVVLQTQGKTIDTVMHRMGIRTFQFDAKNGFSLNGKTIKIKGTNNHQDHAGLGAALPDYMQYYRIQLLKNMGSNAYRTSHNAPTPELLDACDSLGMLVLDEQRLLNSSTEYLHQFERLIKRDRNHPSVFLWSIGNEEGWIQTTTTGKRIAQTLLKTQQTLDPTRTSTYAADLANVFHGVNEVIPVRGFNYRHLGVADYHRDHPNQPLIGTEMGSTVTTRGEYTKDTIRAYVPDQDITAPWWASKAEDWWKPAAENAYWQGGFIWTGFDYRGEPTPYQWPNINSHFGVMDVCGFPKNIYYYYQSWWTDKDVLHISPHWNWQGKEGQPIDVWVNTNADDVELFLNGKSLGKKIMPRNGHLQWEVIYAPGKLEAIAYKKGKRLTAAVETTGTPAEVVITPYKTTMLADGTDVSVVNVSIIDREGREVPNADNRIQFFISGNAKIIGVGNGDPSSHEPDKCVDGAWQRNAFNGKCQVIVQSGTIPSIIKFEAKAAGLWTGATDIITVDPKLVSAIQVNDKYALKGMAALPRSATKMMGADISFLPELEAKGIQFSEDGKKEDAITLLKMHGFNYIRLRIFNDPANADGYSPTKGFCDLKNTLAMAKRVKAAGLKLLLDFHYSDFWADPGKQFKPAAWKGLEGAALADALYTYTQQVMQALKDQGTLPDMVQVGNEINHGIVWPDGSVADFNTLAQLFKAGTAAVKSVHPEAVIMLHIALGGQNHESIFFLDNMLARGVHFDVIGESYYPKWHSNTADLQDNLTDLVHRYGKDVIVVEYSQLKAKVNKIAFELPDGKGKGTCIWEPLSTWESIFDWKGNANQWLKLYDTLSKLYLQ
ncbi:MAG: beta-galactosidase GalA [Ferruginibacter sp.]